jgi:tRNA-specific 2-thiouridylase
MLRGVNWLGEAPIPADGLDVAVRIRSGAPPQPATLFHCEDNVKVLLRDGDYGIAAGQACVFYADAGPRARVLGGGWIERTSRQAEQAGRRGEDTSRHGAGQPARVGQ